MSNLIYKPLAQIIIWVQFRRLISDTWKVTKGGSSS